MSLAAPISSDADVHLDRAGLAQSIGSGRSIALLAVHHVRPSGVNLTGGAEKYILQVTAALLEAGASVHVGYSGSDIYSDLAGAAPTQRLVVERLDWIGPDLKGDARFSLRILLRRREWLRATRAKSLFVIQQGGGSVFYNSLLAARSLGMRVVATIRQAPPEIPCPRDHRLLGLIPSPQRWRRRQIARVRRPARLCHRILFNSGVVAREYCQLFGIRGSRVQIIPNGESPPGGISGALRRPARRIVAVGRLSQAKGADTLLEAFGILARKRTGVSLSFFGEGEMLPILRQRAANLDLLHMVQFRGFISDREAIYRDADICVHLSRREAMSNSVIEAMARGIPCVATNVGGMGELIAHELTGLLVPVGDAPAAAAALGRLMDDPAFAERLGRHGRAHCLLRHDLRSVMKQTVAAILGRPNRMETPPWGFEPQSPA